MSYYISELWSTKSMFRPKLRSVRVRWYSSLGGEDLARKIYEASRTQSFLHPPPASGLSAELREKLTTELRSFFKDFVEDVDVLTPQAKEQVARLADVESRVGGSVADLAHDMRKVGSIPVAEDSEEYTPAEMYMRQRFHNRGVARLGAELDLSASYVPHAEATHYKNVYEAGIADLIAAGAHLGHATGRLRPNCLPYVYGVREGIHIIDLQQTLAGLRRAARVVRELVERAGLVLFVGTRDGQREMVERAAVRSGQFYVHTRWVPGTLTNFSVINEQKRQVGRVELDMADHRTPRQLSPGAANTIIKPDLVFVLNPVENRALLHECIRMRVPTAGLVDTDSEPSLLTYPIPGNDDSLRFAELVLGVLAKQAQRGRAARLAAFNRSRSERAAEEAEPKRPAVINEKERALLDSS